MPEEPLLTPPEEVTSRSRVATALNPESSTPDAEEGAGETPVAKTADAWVSEFGESALPSLQPATRGLSGPHIPLVLWVAVLVLTASAGLLWRLRPQHQTVSSNTSRPTPASQSRAEPKAGALVPEASTTGSKQAISQNSESPGAAAPVKVTGLEHMSHQETTSVVIHLNGNVEYQEHRLSGPERIYLDIPHTQLTPELLGRKSQVNELLVRKIRIAQPMPLVTRLTMETAGYCDYKIEATTDHLAVEVKQKH